MISSCQPVQGLIVSIVLAQPKSLRPNVPGHGRGHSDDGRLDLSFAPSLADSGEAPAAEAVVVYKKRSLVYIPLGRMRTLPRDRHCPDLVARLDYLFSVSIRLGRSSVVPSSSDAYLCGVYRTCPVVYRGNELTPDSFHAD